MAGLQASSTIEYSSLNIIGQWVFTNTIVNMIFNATSEVALWCWGKFWSLLALGCGTFWFPIHLANRIAWAGVAQSDLYNELMRFDFGCFSHWGDIAQLHFRKLEAEGMQWQCWHRSESWAVAPVQFVIAGCGATPQQVGSSHYVHPICNLWYWMTLMTLQCYQLYHHQSPTQHYHPTSSTNFVH